ncbi:M48 family metalloprotease [Gryllotalpicola ginsengisoli]|uniref:M48 family metalloprotease n=1 Tax=Gryllotalpicola ginsengisoli TaxID=444608 RepID=UPI0003B67965|nr:M48 family metalloprotease [Gryllotalpicola ginsengisoli]
MYRAIARNKRNTVFFILFFLVLVGAVSYAVSYLMGGGWSIAIIAMVIALAYAVLQYFTAGAQAVAMAGAVEIQKADHPVLWQTVENIAISTGMPMPRVYIVNDPAPNAFATGRDPEHAVVAATTGLLEIMNPTELMAVMAHEMGHVRNYDIRVSTVVFGLVVAIGFIADIFIRFAFYGAVFGGGNRRDNNNGGGGGGNPVVLVLGLVAVVLAPVIAAMVQAAISRQREYLADATSAEITRYPEGLESALAKLGDYARPMRRQNTSMAHLWIADPLRPSLMSRLFSTHPPIPDRIARLQQIGQGF